MSNNITSASRATPLGRWPRWSARILTFPPRSPFVVQIMREDRAWLVIARNHSWLHGSRREALAEARELATGFGVVVAEVAG